MSNLYVYGVIKKEGLELETECVGSYNKIYTVDHRKLSAVVSDIDSEEIEESDENIEIHDYVLREILEYDGGRTIVPMSFGMIFKNSRVLKSVIRGARRAFRKALNDIEGKVELGVKLITEKDTSIEEKEIENISDQLSMISTNETDNDLFSDRLVLNKSYLVKRENREKFDDKIDEIKEKYDDKIKVRYTGPWAPYNFVDIHIGAQKQK